MLTLEIDGQRVTVEDGATVMDAAHRLGIYIPHFCYHKKLSIAASCRMCLVEVEKAPKPVPACATPATNGMRVWTHSPKAVAAQKGVMEFLLINHPLDCPICDQGGECQLQDLAVGYGQSAHCFSEPKRVVADKDLGPLIATFMTRCIHCTRCVRFLMEVGGYQELGQAFRGEHSEIMPFLEQTVRSEISGNIIDLCPVGALTSKPFLYRARTWELTRRRSVSPHDAWGSNVIVQSRFDQVLRVLPFEEESINECWLSDRDRFAYLGLDSTERLTQPLVKRGSEWVAVEWETALQVAVNRLNDVRAQEEGGRVAVLAHPMATVEELFLARTLAETLEGECDARLRQSSGRADSAREGAAWLNSTISEIAAFDGQWFLGSDLRRHLPLMAVRVRTAARRGAYLVAWSWVADEWRVPGLEWSLWTPATMGAALAKVALVVARRAGDDGALPRWVAEWAADAALSEEGTVALVQRLERCQRRRIWLGEGLLAHPQAAELEFLAGVVATRIGATVGWLVEGANAVGAAAVGANGAQSASELVAEPRAAYVLLHAEPEDFLVPQQAVEAFSRARTVVALSAFASASLRETADVLLPVTPFTETSGSFVNIEGRVQPFTAVVRPRGESRPGWRVLAALTTLLGREARFASTEAVRGAALREGWRERLATKPIARPPVGVPALERVEPAAVFRWYQTDPIVRRSTALAACTEEE
ncbi:MAG: NADH-quinone oxidoreductase subunit NuoG [Hydrogenophilus sp.]|nr:NADH-quinone oxidoreductase subunit NuoG [Hydrogenophilus sp.]